MKKFLAILLSASIIVGMVVMPTYAATGTVFTPIQGFEGSLASGTDYWMYTGNPGLRLSASTDTAAPLNSNETTLTSSAFKVTVDTTAGSNPGSWQEFVIKNPLYGTSLSTSQPTSFEYYIDTTNITIGIAVRAWFLTSSGTRYELPDGNASFTYNYQSSAGGTFSQATGGYRSVWFNGSGGFKKGFLKFNISDYKNGGGQSLTDITTVDRVVFSMSISGISNGTSFYIDSLNFSGNDTIKVHSSIESFEGTNSGNAGLYSQTGPILSFDSSNGTYDHSETSSKSSKALKVTFDTTQGSWQEYYVSNYFSGRSIPGAQPTQMELYLDTTYLTKGINIGVSLITSAGKYQLSNTANSFTCYKQSAIGTPAVSASEGYGGVWFNGSGGFKKGFIRFNLSDFKLNGSSITDFTTVTKIVFSSGSNQMNNGEYYFVDSLNFIGQDTLNITEYKTNILNLNSRTLGSVNLSTDSQFFLDGSNASTASIVDVAGEKAISISKTASGWNNYVFTPTFVDYSASNFLEFYVDTTGMAAAGWFSLSPYIFTTSNMRYDLPGYGGYVNNSYSTMADGQTTWTNQLGSYNSLGNGVQNFKGMVRIPLAQFIQSYYYANPQPAATQSGYATLLANLNTSKITRLGFGYGSTGTLVIKNIAIIKLSSYIDTYAPEIRAEGYAQKMTSISDIANNSTLRRSHNVDVRILFNEGTATLNGNSFTSATALPAITKSYTLIATDSANNSSTINFDYIINGEVNGDGSIDLTDLVAVKTHLLKISPLTGINNTAADVDANSTISISDLIAIKKYLLSVGTLE